MKYDKKFAAFAAVVLVLLAIGMLQGSLGRVQDAGMRAPLSTVQRRSEVVATVTADASAITNTTASYSQASTLFRRIEPAWNSVSLSFYGYGDGTGAGSPVNATFSYDVFVVDLYGGMEPVSLGNTGVIGTQQLSHHPSTGALLNSGAVSSDYCWADTLTEGTVSWSTSLGYSNNLGTDYRAKTKFDRQESFGVYVRIYDMTAQSVTSITCIVGGY